MRIRMATERDVPEMLAIYQPYIESTAITFEYEVPTEEAFLTRFRTITAQCPWLVCEDAGALLGYAYADKAFVRAAFRWDADFSIYLRENARGRGIGTCLYRLLERMAALQGYQVIYGLVTSDNDQSCRFHEKMGYRRTAYLPDCGYKFGNWYGLSWYEKRLCAPVQPASAPTPNPEMDWRVLQTEDLEKQYHIQIDLREV